MVYVRGGDNSEKGGKNFFCRLLANSEKGGKIRVGAGGGNCEKGGKLFLVMKAAIVIYLGGFDHGESL